MAVRAVSFAADGSVRVVHEELGHVGTLTAAQVDARSTATATGLGCPGCGAVSFHPVGGGCDPVGGQFLAVQVALRRLRATAPQTTLATVRAQVKAQVATADGPGRWVIGSLVTEVFGFDLATMLVLVLAGQSNMNGYTPLLEPSRAEDGAVAIFENGDWRTLVDPTVPGQSRSLVGPGVPCARALVAAGVGRVGLVPCAESGSGIAAWARGHLMYDRAQARIQASGARVGAVLFYQGEADSRRDTDGADAVGYPQTPAAAWGAAFRQVVADWRRDAGDPSLAFLVAQLPPSSLPPATHDPAKWATVRAQQAASVAPRIALVSTVGVAVTDGVHIDAPSQVLVGGRFAAAWRAL